MKRTLISVQDNQTKIAITIDGKLVDLHIDSADIKLQKSNIYMGRISHIEPSLNAVFVHYGDTKDAFLPMKDIVETYLLNNDTVTALKVNQNLIIQVSKDKKGTKGAYVTTFVSLAGCYIVFMPNSPKAKPGISKRIQEKDRERIKNMLANLELPAEGKIITRSAAIYATTALIQAELLALMTQWDKIKQKAQQNVHIGLLHQDNTLAARIMREYLIEAPQEVIIDNQAIFQALKSLLQISRPALAEKIHFFNHRNLSIFQYYGIEQALKNIFDREIPLKSGGSIIIDNTEALIAIDVNSAKSTGHKNIEETALNTNIEAVAAIADQLRFRNISGLIIVDLIDMTSPEHRLLIEEKFIEAMSQDRARIQMTRISKLGLIEISRQNLSPAVRDTLMLKCSACGGLGRVPSDRSFTFAVLKSIKTHLHTHPASAVTVKIPHNIALKVLEHHLMDITDIETVYQTRIIFLSDHSYNSAHININGLNYQHEPKPVVPAVAEVKAAGSELQILLSNVSTFLFGTKKQAQTEHVLDLDRNRVKVADIELCVSPGGKSSVTSPKQRQPKQTSQAKPEVPVVPNIVKRAPKIRQERSKSKQGQDHAAGEIDTPLVILLNPHTVTAVPVAASAIPAPKTRVAPLKTQFAPTPVLLGQDDVFVEVETKQPETTP